MTVAPNGNYITTDPESASVNPAGTFRVLVPRSPAAAFCAREIQEMFRQYTEYGNGLHRCLGKGDGTSASALGGFRQDAFGTARGRRFFGSGGTLNLGLSALKGREVTGNISVLTFGGCSRGTQGHR